MSARGYVVTGEWLAVDVGEHTCGTGRDGHYGAHEPGCGLEPVAKIADLLAADSRAADLEATVARVEALPHEDFCCAKGCPGPGFCEGCEGTESDCKCIVAHVRAALSGRGNAASGEKWQALRAAFSDPFNRRARLLDADTHEVAP